MATLPPMDPEEEAAYRQLGKELNAKTQGTLGQEVPRVESTSSTVTETYSSTSTVPAAVSFSVTDAITKVNEAGTAAINAVGPGIRDAIGPFTKFAANAPTLQAITSAALFKQGGGIPSLVANQLGKFSNDFVGMPTAASIKAGVKPVTNSHKVSLREIGGGPKDIVVFEVMPEVVEAHSVEYEPVAPAQFPGAFQKYKGTASTQYTLNVTLISRTSKEADDNLVLLNLLRGWKEPFFGVKTDLQFPGKLGAPPPVLELQGLRNLVGPVPVVITALNWTWPKDVDYLPTTTPFSGVDGDGNFIPFPAVMQVAIQLVESYSTGQFNGFSLADYRAGRMRDAFTTIVPVDVPAPAAGAQPVPEEARTVVPPEPGRERGGGTVPNEVVPPMPGRERGGGIIAEPRRVIEKFRSGEGGDFGGGGASGSF